MHALAGEGDSNNACPLGIHGMASYELASALPLPLLSAPRQASLMGIWASISILAAGFFDHGSHPLAPCLLVGGPMIGPLAINS